MTADKTPTDALEPCPFCNGRAQLNPAARDWWRIVIDHEEYCALSGHYDDVIVPQDDESRAWLIDRWNTRANCGSPVVAGEPWGASVGDRVWVGKLPAHVPKLAEAEGLPIQWLYTTPQPTQAQAGAGAENLELRRMLCVAHAGAAAYMDDGEAQDSRDLPVIDFLRDSPPEIRDKLNRRALKKLAARGIKGGQHGTE